MNFVNYIEDLHETCAKNGAFNRSPTLAAAKSANIEETKKVLDTGANSGLSAYSRAEQETLQTWLDRGFFGQLVDFAIDNFDDGSGNQFIETLSDALVKANQHYKLERLWKGVISLRRARTILAESRADAYAQANNSSSLSKTKKQTLHAMEKYFLALRAIGNHTAAAKIDRARQHFSLCKWGEHKNLQSLSLDANDGAALLPADKRKIDESLFWQLIDESRLASESDVHMALYLKRKLKALAPSQIRKFQSLLLNQLKRSYLPELRQACYLAFDDQSADLFDAFRSGLISQGKTAFEEALIKPPSLAALRARKQTLLCERFADAAHDAFIDKTGAPMKHATNQRFTLNTYCLEPVET